MAKLKHGVEKAVNARPAARGGINTIREEFSRGRVERARDRYASGHKGRQSHDRVRAARAQHGFQRGTDCTSTSDVRPLPPLRRGVRRVWWRWRAAGQLAMRRMQRHP